MSPILEVILVLWSSVGLLIFLGSAHDLERDYERGKANGYQVAFIMIIYGPIVWCILLALLVFGAGITFYDWLGTLDNNKKKD